MLICIKQKVHALNKDLVHCTRKIKRSRSRRTVFWILMPVLILLFNPAIAAKNKTPDACEIKQLVKSEIQGLKKYSPDGERFLVNKEDVDEVAQVYIGTTSTSGLECITCSQQPGGPKPQRFKMQPHWHPSGDWIILAVERDEYTTPPLLGWSDDYVEGMLQNGLWMDMYAISPDGNQWHKLLDSPGINGKSGGYTGPAFTADGTRAVWSQIVNGNILQYWPFGKWELILADFIVEQGVPKMINRRNITPSGMHWNEPGNFAPDGKTLLLSGSVEDNASGMDQYKLDVDKGKLVNLTRTPGIWDEHGAFSPDGRKIIFMSAWPYRDDPGSSNILMIKTEFMLMNSDGSGLVQLTRFREPGSPQESGIAANMVWNSDGRSANLLSYYFPNLEYWDLEFEGPCGNNLQ